MNPLFTTSWDDGHLLDFRVAELLSRHGLAGTFYIPRSAPTGVMEESRIAELSKSFEIGAHTLSHVFLTQTSDETARQEIVDSRAWVEELTGGACRMFCPPAGKFTAAHVGMIREAGYIGLRSVEMYSVALPRFVDGLLVMPTTLQAHPHRPVALLKNCVKRFAPGNLWRYVVRGDAADWPRAAENLMCLCRERGGVFHLWGHSWELEEAGQWSRLEQVLALMGQFVPAVACVSNSAVCDLVISSGAGSGREAAAGSTGLVGRTARG